MKFIILFLVTILAINASKNLNHNKNTQHSLIQVKQAPVDLAIGATPSASSLWDNSVLPKPIQPGAKNGNWGGNTCYCSGLAADSWYSIELQEPAEIGQIVITNRSDCCEGRLRDFDVLVDDVKCFRRDEPVGAGEQLVIDSCGGQVGQKITVAYNENRVDPGAGDHYNRPWLQICGLQVFSPVKPNCAVMYSECGFSGDAVYVCDEEPDVNMDVNSVYVPEGKTLAMYNLKSFEGQRAAFSESVECIEGDIDYSFLQSHGITIEE